MVSGFRRHGSWLACALALSATGLTACGDDSPDPAATKGESILIHTRMNGFSGKVLPSSLLGDARFCAGGTVRHEFGSRDIGFPAVNVFHCPDGELKIGFGPGPDQADKAVQTSGWKVVGGDGRFAGAAGEGRMKVRFEAPGSAKGQETFTGHLVVP